MGLRRGAISILNDLLVLILRNLGPLKNVKAHNFASFLVIQVVLKAVPSICNNYTLSQQGDFLKCSSDILPIN